MGTAAIPLMIGATAVSTVGSIYSAQRQGSIMRDQAMRQKEQAGNEARDAEINRLQAFQEQFANNIAMGAIGGADTTSGNFAQVQEGAINKMEQDVKMIQTGGALSQRYADIQAQNAQSMANINSFNALAQGVASGANIYSMYDKTKTPNKPNTGTVTGISQG